MCLFFRKRKKTEKIRLGNKKWPYSKQDFERVYSILEDLEWITPRESQLWELLYELLKEDNERDLLEELLRKVVYLNDDDSRAKCKEIANVILNVWNCQESETVIVGAKKKDSSDGGDVLIYNLRNYLGWKEKRLQTTYRDLQSINNVKSIIIADDFTGTGKRMNDVINDIVNLVPGVTIRFVSIGLMESTVKKHYPGVLSYQYFAPVILFPGINHEKDKRVELMKQVESYLAPRWNGLSIEHYHLGYK